ncbi:hypothetical protein BpHYR1_020356 [Brachionus plicatilis]|uniref:Uncharacterized protein n=1 Tax=Brachionus plicatilis TaxID=10195 RepID=A0A3M7QHM4_BRAPC|nr:hypothetical protein BpHYR1_020356 [Brachionus plicatilis]
MIFFPQNSFELRLFFKEILSDSANSKFNIILFLLRKKKQIVVLLLLELREKMKKKNEKKGE